MPMQIMVDGVQRDMTSEEELEFTNSMAQISPIVTVPQEISDRQFFVELAVRKLITEREAEDAVAVGAIPPPLLALINQLPEEARFPARMFIKGATEFYRKHEMTIGIGTLYGFDSDALDDFFIKAEKL